MINNIRDIRDSSIFCINEVFRLTSINSSINCLRTLIFFALLVFVGTISIISCIRVVSIVGISNKRTISIRSVVSINIALQTGIICVVCMIGTVHITRMISYD